MKPGTGFTLENCMPDMSAIPCQSSHLPHLDNDQAVAQRVGTRRKMPSRYRGAE
jgi:hypothetical protein